MATRATIERRMTTARERLQYELEVHRRSGLKRLPARAAAAAAPQPSPPPALAPAPAVPLFVAAAAVASNATVAERGTELAKLAQEVAACSRCKLCEQRHHAVPGEGALDPPILFIGEGPGADEDATGRPFVGRAGQLLDKMIVAIKLRREQVYIANIVKCRPPENRTPEPDEVRACAPFLERQIALLKPQLICTLGLPATRALLPEVRSISAVRGREFRLGPVPLIPTFHPAYLLRNPAAKPQAWEDLKSIARRIGLPVDGR
jgi:DNA polymerase